MMKTLFAAVALAAVPTLAHADESFSYKGSTYTYSVEEKGDLRILRGTADKGRVPFVLKISKSGVSGSYDGQPVEFSLNDVKPLINKAVAVR